MDMNHKRNSRQEMRLQNVVRRHLFIIRFLPQGVTVKIEEDSGIKITCIARTMIIGPYTRYSTLFSTCLLLPFLKNSDRGPIRSSQNVSYPKMFKIQYAVMQYHIFQTLPFAILKSFSENWEN